MTQEMFESVLSKAGCNKGDDGAHALPEGHTMTLHVSHDGVGVAISRVVSLELDGALLEVRDNKGERFMLALEDVYAVSVSGGSKTAGSRTAGFLGK